MNTILRLRCLPSAVRAFLIGCVLSVGASSASALTINIGGHGTVLTQGSGQSTVVELVENPDGTLNLSAEQSGTLAHLGKFTGSFEYIATIDYNTGTTFIGGEGEIRLASGKIFVEVQLVEVGIDYPRPYTGILRITGGTGSFAKAKGFFEITGVDAESLTDQFVLVGLVLNVAKK